jgi:hypothetical protein
MKYYIIFLVIFLIFLVGCNEEADLSDFTVNRTVIAYMAADNDLLGDALADLEEMKQGFSETGVRLIVFIDASGEAPYLLEIGKDTENRIKTYGELNSADAGTLRTVIREITGLYPAEEYGLILWSHGTSWLPSGVALRSFGKDSGKEMNITDLAGALPVKFDFILFDACLMGSVEVAYELREKTNYLIASSTETIYSGFPYDQIIPELLAPEVNPARVAQKYFDYYDNQQGAYRSATISVTDMHELDALAEATALVIGDTPFNMANFDRMAVQRLDVYNEQYVFDFLDFIAKAFPQADLMTLQEQINKTATYKAHTPQFIEEYNISAYCGLGCYIPHPQRNDLNTYYQQLKWCEASGFSKLFKP